MARTKAVLGDGRRDERAEWLFNRIVTTGSLKLREIGGTRSGEIATHRLLSCEDVEPAKLLVPHVARTVAACKDRRVVAVQDTSEINFDRQRRPAAGLGPTGNAGIYGFFVHPVVVVDAEGEALLGVAGAQIWTRDEEPTPMHHAIPFNEKESRRWLVGAEMAAEQLAPVATQVVGAHDPAGRCTRRQRQASHGRDRPGGDRGGGGRIGNARRAPRGARRTRTRRARSPGCPGSQQGSAAGTATISRQVPRPWPADSTASSIASPATGLRPAHQMCESRRAKAKGQHPGASA